MSWLRRKWYSTIITKSGVTTLTDAKIIKCPINNNKIAAIKNIKVSRKDANLFLIYIQNDTNLMYQSKDY